MRIASFNVENLFSRVRAMNLDDWNDGRPILEEYSRLNTILQKPNYTAADKTAIKDGLRALGLGSSDTSRWALLRQNRGKLRRQDGTIVASGRADWIGWVELAREAVNEKAMQMTARVVQDVNADVLAVIEARRPHRVGTFQ